MAHADGTITKAGARVVKNATAYDLTKLYVGSHGTLGVILGGHAQRAAAPGGRAGLVAHRRRRSSRATTLAMRILGSHLAPNRVELLDRDRRGGLRMRRVPARR